MVYWPIRLLLAALSGLLAGLVLALPWTLELRSLLQGAVFGALVLVPFLRPVRWRLARAVVLVAGGMAIQLIAVRLTVHLYTHPLAGAHPHLWVAITLAAIAGALLVAALAQAAIPLPGGSQLWAPVGLAGLLGGLALGLPPALGMSAGWTFGLVIWQVLVCAALYVGGMHLPSHTRLGCTLRGQHSP
jgi:hypothetical protein